MEQEILEIGDKVEHKKFGRGVVQNRSSDNENQKVIVKFAAEHGEKKLVAKIAKLKRIGERPVLQGPGGYGHHHSVPAAVAAVPAVKLPPVKDDAEDEDEDEGIPDDPEVEDTLDDDDDEAEPGLEVEDDETFEDVEAEEEEQ